MITSILFCYFTYDLFNKINNNGLQKNINYIRMKKYLLIIMIVQLMSYLVSEILVAFYNPTIELEKQLLSNLIFTLSINSIVFVFCFILFVWTLKYDLFFVILNMQIMPDIEYFIDMEENIKLIY